MYEFHHEYMASLYRDKCKIVYTDMDSLIYYIECDNVYNIMNRDIDRFDTSDYEVDNMYQVYKYEMTIWETDGTPIQYEVQRFNIIRHFIVPSTSVTAAKIWLKSVCIVLCCCV